MEGVVDMLLKVRIFGPAVVSRRVDFALVLEK
jgi:hypothetical protein